MGYRDPDKKREYDRAHRRKRRAEQRLGLVTGQATATKTRTVSSFVDYVGPGADALKDFDRKLMAFGERAIDLAMQGLETLDPEKLNATDVNRLAQAGVALRNAAASRLEKGETVTEHMILQEAILNDPEALEHAHALLRISAKGDLERTFAEPTPGQGANFISADWATGGSK